MRRRTLKNKLNPPLTGGNFKSNRLPDGIASNAEPHFTTHYTVSTNKIHSKHSDGKKKAGGIKHESSEHIKRSLSPIALFEVHFISFIENS